MTFRDARGGPAHYLSALSHAGRSWEVYFDFEEDDSRARDHVRGHLVFIPVDPVAEASAVRTIPVLIESSHERLLERARTLETHLLESFLRSLLP